MPLCGIRVSRLILLLLLARLQMSAQSARLEQSTNSRFPQPFTYLVNESGKTIEAFHYHLRCDEDTDSPGPIRTSGNIDLLDHYHSEFLVLKADGEWMLSAGIEPGARQWGMSFSGFFDKEGRPCPPKVDTVIFSDGSYEGTPACVQAIQAHRDGIRDSLLYWAERLDKEAPGAWDFAALKAEAVSRHTLDSSALRKYAASKSSASGPEPLLLVYWRGREWADFAVSTDFQTCLKSPKHPLETCRRFALHITQWKKNIETDVSMQKLSAEFPPITEDHPMPEDTDTQR
jgi:hypothetical protein